MICNVCDGDPCATPDFCRSCRKADEATRPKTALAKKPSPQTSAPLSAQGLFDKVEKFLGRFVAYPSEHAHVAHVLWVAHAHFMEAWDSTPRLAALSPEPASGKTRLLEVTALLVPNAVEAINVTPAYLFRKVGNDCPTILFDEIDTVFGPKAKDNEELRGLLNAGHRKGAMAGRCVVRGTAIETEEIPAYCAVALAGLGWLPDTLLSRSIIIRMRRRAKNEHVEPYRHREHSKEGHDLRDAISFWASSAIDGLTEARPEMPAGVEDRDADVWEALLAIADEVGGDWPRRARSAAVSLVSSGKEAEPSLGIKLLGDIKEVFGDHYLMTSFSILSALHNLPEAPWNDLRGRPLNARGLAVRLKEYGVRSKQVRVNSETTQKGYDRADLHDAWVRYLPSPQGSETGKTSETTTINQTGTVSDGDGRSETEDHHKAERFDSFVSDVSDVSCLAGDHCAHCGKPGDDQPLQMAGDGVRQAHLHRRCQAAYFDNPKKTECPQMQ